MKHKNFWMYFLFGVVIGVVVGFMKNEVAVWVIAGSILGFLVALLFESKAVRDKIPPEHRMWIGFFLLFPVMFFDDYLKGSFWYDVFGILAVIGSFVIIVNFVTMLRKRKVKK